MPTVEVSFTALPAHVRTARLVATAVARGDLTHKIAVDVKGEMLELKETLNKMVDELSAFADEVTRVAREVGTEGMLGGQASVPGVGGSERSPSVGTVTLAPSRRHLNGKNRSRPKSGM